MKRFNPNKELKKYKINKKNLGVFLFVFLIALVIGHRFAKFNLQKQTYSIMDSVVEKFNSGDKGLSVLVDGVEQDSFPSKESGKVYKGIRCTSGSKAAWDSTNWRLILRTSGSDVCIVEFIDRTKLSGVTVVKGLIDDYKEGNIAGNPVTMAEDDFGNVRYIGSDPNNYVNFNNETWRIIGVFPTIGEDSEEELRIKLIRNESLGDSAWSEGVSGINNGNGINQWGQALMPMVITLVQL